MSEIPMTKAKAKAASRDQTTCLKISSDPIR
jgi:hypothetical protein